MAMTNSSTQLSCGRDIDQVWDHLDRAADPHERDCPYCQGARADLAGLADATRSMRGDEATDPDLQVDPAILDRILALARAEVRRGRRLPLDRPGPDRIGRNTVSEQAVAAVVRRAGDRTGQIQVRRCTLTPVEAVAGEVPGLGPPAVEVSLTVSIGRDAAIADASSRLRSAVVEAVSQEVGIEVRRVDIQVEDLHDA